MCPPLLLAAVPAITSALGTLGIGAGAAALPAAASTAFGFGSAAGIANLSGALGAVSTITGFIGQTQAAAAAKKAANLNFANKTTALTQENTQLSARESEDHVSAAIKSAQTFGRISASAAAMGLGNSTLSPYLDAAEGSVSRDSAIEDLNTNSKRVELGSEATGARLERDSTIAAHPSPSPVSLALGLGKDAFGAASLFSQLGGKFGAPSGAPA